MRKLRQIGRVLFSFILMFLVVALIGVIFMKEVLLNANDINNELNDSEYYSQVEDSLAAKFKTLSLETSSRKIFLLRRRPIATVCNSFP